MPTTRSKASPKIQAHLSFQPVSKDSTQAQELSASVRSRAAAVKYFSPKKATGSRGPLTRDSAVTRQNSRIKQQKLQIATPVPRRSTRQIQSDGLADENDTIYVSQHRSSPGPSRKLPSSSIRARRSSPAVNEEDGETVSLRPRRALISSPLPPLTSSPPEAISSSEEDTHEVLPPTGTRRRPQILDDDDLEDENVAENSSALPATKLRSKIREAENNEVSALPTSLRRTRNGNRRVVDEDPDETTQAESKELEPPSLRKSRRSTVIISDDEDTDRDIEINGSDSDDIMPSSSRPAKRRHIVEDEDDEDYDNDDVLTSSSPTKKRRLQHGPKPRRETREEQDEEILKEAEELRETATFNEGLQSKSKTNSKKAIRQRELAKLQRRRNKTLATGSQVDLSSSPSPEPELPLPYNGGYSDEDSSQADSIINDDILSDDDASETSEIRMSRAIHSIPSALYYMIQAILYEKFIPPSFSFPSPQINNSNFDPHPNPKPVSKTYYNAAHNMIDKHLESYKNQFLSSVWRKPFVAALHARPHLTWPSNSIPLWESCEACGRRDRPATFAIRFDGDCYDETTLETYSSPSASSSDDEDSNSGAETDNPSDHVLTGPWAKYNVKVPRSRIWHVGADCHDNAWRAHRAAHWKFGLAEQINKVLGMMGVEISTAAASCNAESSGADNQAAEAEQEQQQEETALLLEDRFHATLLQIEEQGYMRALVDEFLERFEMDIDDDDDD